MSAASMASSRRWRSCVLLLVEGRIGGERLGGCVWVGELLVVGVWAGGGGV